jgi:hypothetical protein
LLDIKQDNVSDQPVASVDYQFQNGNQRDSVALHGYAEV